LEIFRPAINVPCDPRETDPKIAAKIATKNYCCEKFSGGTTGMNVDRRTRTAGQVLVASLLANRVDHVFCVPGESYLAVLDALHDAPITLTTCRQEGGAAIMAEAYGKARGRPGICMVTRGPGVANAMAGLHIAQQDSTPMIVFVGQVDRAFRGREAWQEMDLRAVFGSLCKWVFEIDQPDRMPEIIARAFHMALAGRPGPVVIGLPQDMLVEASDVADAPLVEGIETAPDPAAMAKLPAMLAAASRPIMILGGTRWSAQSCRQVREFAARFALPVATSFRRAGLFDALDPHYAGDLGVAANPKLLARIRAADLVIVVNGRLGEVPSQGYALFDIPQPRCRLVHIHADAAELGAVFRPDLAIHATPACFADALDRIRPDFDPPWRGETAAAHADYLAWTENPLPQPGGVDLGAIIKWLRENQPQDAIVCSGAGNFTVWVHRYYRTRQFGTQIAPIAGSMGYAMPAAVAMQRLDPDRLVLSFNGDGDFLMHGQEFATAVLYQLPIIAIVCDNGIYGTIRVHQERAYPGRKVATDLANPDFAAYANIFGGFGIAVERTDDFPAAFAAARASGKPAIIHLKIDPEAITPGTPLSRIAKSGG